MFNEKDWGPGDDPATDLFDFVGCVDNVGADEFADLCGPVFLFEIVDFALDKVEHDFEQVQLAAGVLEDHLKGAQGKDEFVEAF